MGSVLKRKIAIILTLDSNKVRKGLAVISSKLERLGKLGRRAFGFAAKAGLVLGAVFTGLAVKATLTASRTEVLESTFKLVGKTAGISQKQLAGYQKSIRGLGISTQEALKLQIRFIQSNLNLADSLKIARAAQDLAVVAGEDSSTTAVKLTEALVIQQPRLLKQFGILINLNVEFAKLARTLGKTRDALTSAEKRTVFMNAILKKAESVSGAYTNAMKLVGKQLTSLPRHFQDLENTMGNFFLPVFSDAVIFAGDFLKSLTAIGKSEEFKSFVNSVLPQLRSSLNTMFRRILRFFKSGEVFKWLDKFSDAFNTIFDMAKIWIPKILGIFKALATGIETALGPVFRFFANNPAAVKAAVIIVVLTKAIKLAKSFAAAMSVAPIANALGRGAAGVATGTAAGAAISRAAPLASRLALPAAAGAGAAASGAGGGIAAALGGISIATIGAIVAAVLALSLVGAIIFHLFNRNAKGQPGGTPLAPKFKGQQTNEELLSNINKLAELKRPQGVFTSRGVQLPGRFPVEIEPKEEPFDPKKSNKDIPPDLGAFIGKLERTNEEKRIEIANRKELLMITNEGLREEAEIRQRWAEQFRFIQENLGSDLSVMSKEQHVAQALQDQELKIARLERQKEAFEDQSEGVQEFEQAVKDLEFDSANGRIESFTEFVDRKSELALGLQDLLREISENELLSEEKMDELRLKLQAITAGKLEKGTIKALKREARIRESFNRHVQQADIAFRTGQLNLQQAFGVSALQFASEQAIEELDILRSLWLKKAAGFAATGNFVQAARFAAGAGLLTAGAAFIQQRTQAAIEKITADPEEEDQFGGSSDSGFSDRGKSTRSGFTTRGVQNLFIQPSISFSAETIIVGEVGVDTAGEAIGRIAVDAVRDSIETGELNVG